MPIKLNTASGGGVILQGANTASDKTITIPADDGTMIYANSSGNVGIGTSSPLSTAMLEVSRSTTVIPTATVTADNQVTGWRVRRTGGTYPREWYLGIRENSTALDIYDNTADALRARIDSSGNLLLNTTSASVTNRAATFNVNNIASRDTLGLKQDANTLFNICSLVSTTSGTRYHIGFGDGTTFTERGTISTNGTSTTYSTSSDYRLKENITPMTGALVKVAQMRPVNWTWKENGEAGQGFIAHELQSVIPDAVVGQKDEVDENGLPRYQSVDTSFLVATLTAAIQELKAEVDSLRAQVEAK